MNYAFIGGSGRSGTTILKKILSRHPAVAVSDQEWRFTIDAGGLVDFYMSMQAGWTPHYYEAKLRQLEHLLRINGRRAHPFTEVVKLTAQKLGLERKLRRKTREAYATSALHLECPRWDELTDDLMHGLTEFAYPGWWKGTPFLAPKRMRFAPAPERETLARALGDFYRAVADCCAARRNAALHVDDNPQMFLWFHRFVELVPEAKMAHIYRDPRDVTASYATKRWAPSDPVLAAKVLRATMEQWLRVRPQIPARNLLEVRMETLMDDTETTMRRIAEFWGVEWDDALLSVDLRHAHSGRWREEFTAAQRREVQAILADVMSEYGYEREDA